VLGKGAIRPGFALVFRREVDHFRRRPFLLFLSTLMPLILMGLLATVFHEGLATRLPIAVLDLDGSDLSRTVIRTVDATPDTAVAVRVADLAEGRHLILSGKVHGLLYLPLNLERDTLAGRRPEVVFFYNTQTLTPGNLTLRGVSAAVPSVAAAIRLALRTEKGEPVDIAQTDLQPIPVQVHPLFNPTLNYAYFLLAALLPSVLQVAVITTMAYCVGLDVDRPYRLRVLRRLGGGLWRALFGKILPYTILFLFVLGLSDIVLFSVLEMPLRGDRLLLVCGGILFVLACQFLGTLFALILRPTATAISIGALFAAPAFGFMGIGFPRLGMNFFAYHWGQLLPGTWYLMVRVDQTVRGTPVDLSLQPLLSLLALMLILLLLVFLRLTVLGLRTDRMHATRRLRREGGT
jgi:ABC-2 type transport system permease protein